MGGVNSARIETHRLHHLVNRAMKLVEVSPEREHLYSVAGDMIVAVPKRLALLERDLDKTALALSMLGEDFLKNRLSLSDRVEVEDALEGAGHPFGRPRSKGASSMAERVAQRYLESDEPIDL